MWPISMQEMGAIEAQWHAVTVDACHALPVCRQCYRASSATSTMAYPEPRKSHGHIQTWHFPGFGRGDDPSASCACSLQPPASLRGFVEDVVPRSGFSAEVAERALLGCWQTWSTGDSRIMIPSERGRVNQAVPHTGTNTR